MQDKSATSVKNMFANIASRYDLSNDLLSFGIHRYWESRAISMLPEDPSAHCLDVCTGTGALLKPLYSKYENVVGIDFCPEMIEIAKKNHSDALSANLELIIGDALSLPYDPNSFDIITVAYGVRNFSDLSLGLQEMHRVLKPGGTLMVLEFGQPSGIIKPFYNFYSKHIMPSLGSLITGNKEAYQYLPETAASFLCGERFSEQLKSVGFNVQSLTPFFSGISYSYLSSKES